MVFELDGREMISRAAAHAHLAARLELPDYYGRNLDALYDLLCEDGRERTVRLRHRADMEEQMGHYAVALVDTLQDAAEKNPALTVWVE